MHLLIASAAVIFVSGILISCGPGPTEEKSQPADEASIAERAVIDRTRSRLEKLFQDNGYEGTFDKMPIIVVSPEAGKPGWAGRCVGIGHGTGRYIAITRWAFQDEDEDDSDSRLTAVLLHEIGHCYFAREHDHELVTSANYVTDLEYSGRRGRRRSRVQGVPATVMYVERNHFPHSSIVTSNKEFLNYYVRELLGYDRIHNFQDLRKFKSIKMRIKSDFAEGDPGR